jgi:stage IV sporulation protein FB
VRRAERQYERGALARPIVIAESRPVMSVVHLFMKEGVHLVYVMRKGRIVKVLPEETIIDGFLGRLTSGHADLRFFM